MLNELCLADFVVNKKISTLNSVLVVFENVLYLHFECK